MTQFRRPLRDDAAGLTVQDAAMQEADLFDPNAARKRPPV
jgi:hypothetical protein